MFYVFISLLPMSLRSTYHYIFKLYTEIDQGGMIMIPRTWHGEDLDFLSISRHIHYSPYYA